MKQAGDTRLYRRLLDMFHECNGMGWDGLEFLLDKFKGIKINGLVASRRLLACHQRQASRIRFQPGAEV